MSISPPDFVVVVPAGDDDRIVSVKGEIDCDTSPQLRDHIVRLIDSSIGDLVVDLSDVPAIDWSGLSVLVEARSRLANAARHLRLARVSEPVWRMLERSGLGELCEIRSRGSTSENYERWIEDRRTAFLGYRTMWSRTTPP